jgi:hypothetical protein
MLLTFLSRQLVFIIAGAITGLLAICCYLMWESRPSNIVRRRVKSVAERNGRGYLPVVQGHGRPKSLRDFARTSMFMPFKLLRTGKRVVFVTVLSASVVSVEYGMLLSVAHFVKTPY